MNIPYRHIMDRCNGHVQRNFWNGGVRWSNACAFSLFLDQSNYRIPKFAWFYSIRWSHYHIPFILFDQLFIFRSPTFTRITVTMCMTTYAKTPVCTCVYVHTGVRLCTIHHTHIYYYTDLLSVHTDSIYILSVYMDTYIHYHTAYMDILRYYQDCINQ